MQEATGLPHHIKMQRTNYGGHFRHAKKRRGDSVKVQISRLKEDATKNLVAETWTRKMMQTLISANFGRRKKTKMK